MAPSSPELLLQHALGRLDAGRLRLEQRSRRLSHLRLGLVLGVGVAATAAFQVVGAGAGWVLLGAGMLVFAAVARVHDRVEASRDRFVRMHRIKAHRLARRRRDWDALPPPEPAPVPEDHPFAHDLLVVGPRSLLHLLDTTATAGGSDRLRAWLLASVPDVPAALARQADVRLLAGRGRFRDRLALLGGVMAKGAARWNDAPLRRWLAREEDAGTLRRWLLILSSLALLTAVLVGAHASGGPALWPYSFVVYGVLYLTRFRLYAGLFDETHALADRLAPLVPPLALLERMRWPEGSGLATRRAALPAERPSRLVRRLHRLAAIAALTRSELLALIFNALMPWELFWTVRLHHAKAALRAHLPAWLDAWYDVEALCALATYADDHPEATWPALHDDPARFAFAAEGVAHPLLPPGVAVRNDLGLDGAGAFVLLTGSNMAGKSTFLRTVGANLCLAYAGGAVDARSVSVTALRVFTSMAVHDTLQDGFSFFYAEVRRLKAILDAARAPDLPPVLVLIDELFRGTNNRERLWGGRAYVRALTATRACGLVATHDLDLATLADTLPTLRNAHFRETVEDGRMRFDYRLHPGPCPTTNALRIMAHAGLPVETPPGDDLRKG